MNGDTSDEEPEAADKLTLLEHIVERQINPQRAAAKLREQGAEVVVGFVNTNPDAEGFPVECYGCGRSARLPYDPGAKRGLCPDCIGRGDGLAT
jgi:hypothetical protein